MSQSKTVIQGLEAAETNVGGVRGDIGSNFYSRSGRSNVEHGTIVPDMMNNPNANPANGYSEPKQAPLSRNVVNSGKPVVGFLYSISRTPYGEYWPISIGRNTIGSTSNSNIVLAEGTVSTDHAVIVVRQMKNTGGVIAAITDSMSTNGTMINGETIGFSPVECHNGDIITIGNNYELILILIDTAKFGLSVSKDFIATEIEEDNFDDDIPSFGQGETRPGGFSPFDDGPSWGNSVGYSPASGTVGMDGSVSGNNHGGTIPM